MNAGAGARGEREEAVRKTVAIVLPRVRAAFRRLHRHPEPSWREEATSAFVLERLEELGWKARRLAGTAVIADRRGHGDGDRRAFRADLDAVAAHEATGLPYASEVPGWMHSCGHDAHCAILLGVAEVLKRLDDRLRRPVRLLFQPAEETLPSGAARLVAEGALQRVADVFALHVWPALPTGTIGLRSGVVTAAADAFEVELRGPGGHGARPHETVDLVPLAAELVSALIEVPRARLDPLRQPTVVSVGYIRGGESANVLPDRVTLGGTIRSLDPDSRSGAVRALKETVARRAAAAGASHDFRHQAGPPALVNDAAATRLGAEAVRAGLGPEALRLLECPSMGSEDFSYFTERVPGALLRLGCVPGGGEAHPLHSSEFRVDEEALGVGVTVLAGIALR